MTLIPMDGADAAWWKMNLATNRVIVTALLRFATRLDRAALIATLERGIAPYHQFQSRPVQRGMLAYWEQCADFQVQAHIHESGSGLDVEAWVSELMSQPLPDGVPLWQLYLMDEPNGGTALVFRVHHAVGDGAALVHFLLSLTEGQTNAPIHTRRSTPTPWYEPLRLALATVVTPFQLLLLPPEGSNPFRGALGQAKQVGWSRPIPLDTIKAIGKQSNSTVNDVLMAAVAGALRPFLQPQQIREARTAIPVALRAFGNTPELGNRIGVVFLDLPVGTEAATDRLTLLKKRMNALKRSLQAWVTFVVLWLAGYFPPFLANTLAWFLGTKITSVVTNVPGPQVPLTLAGSPIEQIMFWVPQAGNCGLGVSLLSYNGNVTLGVAIDGQLQPTPHDVIAQFEAEIQQFALPLKP